MAGKLGQLAAGFKNHLSVPILWKCSRPSFLLRTPLKGCASVVLLTSSTVLSGDGSYRQRAKCSEAEGRAWGVTGGLGRHGQRTSFSCFVRSLGHRRLLVPHHWAWASWWGTCLEADVPRSPFSSSTSQIDPEKVRASPVLETNIHMPSWERQRHL